MYRSVLSLRSLVASLLAGVLLLTLVSPHFGWEAVVGGVAGGQHAVADGTGDSVFHGCDDDAADPEAHHHHGCAGHQFSHTPVQVSALLAWQPDLSSQRGVLPPGAGFHSFIPPGLDRPPTQATV
jgi:hypothetical protein